MTQMAEGLSFPRVNEGDSDDLQLALEAGGTLWTQADYSGALRWLSRAAETAARDSLVERAVELTRAAADLRGKLKLASSLPPPAPEPSNGAQPVVRADGDPGVGSASDVKPIDGASAAPIRRYSALRVAISEKTMEDGSLRVRRLVDAEITRPGERLGLLVALDPDLDLTTL